MNKLTITAILLSVSVASATAYAGMDGKKGNKHHGQKHFAMVDTNGDDALSKEEVLNFHEQRFTEMDADSDGLVTKKEMKSYRKEQRSKHKKNKRSKGPMSDDEE